MAEYEKRFGTFSQEEKARSIAELEAQTAIRGAVFLSTDEIEELLTLLPANYFKLLFRLRLLEISRGKKEFAGAFAELSDAADKLTRECREQLDSAYETDGDNMVFMMDRLRLVDPALWFRVYRKLKALSLSMAIELEAPDKGRPFEKP